MGASFGIPAIELQSLKYIRVLSDLWFIPLDSACLRGPGKLSPTICTKSSSSRKNLRSTIAYTHYNGTTLKHRRVFLIPFRPAVSIITRL